MAQPPSLPRLMAMLRPGHGDVSPSPPDDSSLHHKRRAGLFAPFAESERGRAPPFGPQSQRAAPLLPPPPHGLHEFLQPFDRHSSLQSMSDSSPRDALAQQDARRVHPVHPVHAEPPPSEPVQRERKSRYLSESDRRAIILRIENGEKQVALAKEYQVSRAAVCNLYKNRKEVLTRANRDPKIKLPKRAKDKERNTYESSEPAVVDSPTEEKDHASHGEDELMSDELSSTESLEAPSPRVDAGRVDRSPPLAQRRATVPDQVLRVQNASSTSFPIRRMVAILRNPQLPQTTLRHVTKRLVRSLIEEVVVCFPHREISVVTASGDSMSSVLPVDDESVCAISMEDHDLVLLQAFMDIFPSSPTGIVSLSRRSDQPLDSWTASSHRLPPVPSHSCVLLLTSSCSTGARVAAALDFLIGYGRINPTSIYVATVIASQPGLARVHQQFPAVTIVSAAVDDHLDEHARIRPGLGDLMERFWHPGTVPR